VAVSQHSQPQLDARRLCPTVDGFVVSAVKQIQTIMTVSRDTRKTVRKWNSCIHKMTMTSSAIILYGQCCRRHFVDQRVVSDIRALALDREIKTVATKVNPLSSCRRHDRQLGSSRAIRCVTIRQQSERVLGTFISNQEHSYALRQFNAPTCSNLLLYYIFAVRSTAKAEMSWSPPICRPLPPNCV